MNLKQEIKKSVLTTQTINMSKLYCVNLINVIFRWIIRFTKISLSICVLFYSHSNLKCCYQEPRLVSHGKNIQIYQSQIYIAYPLKVGGNYSETGSCTRSVFCYLVISRSPCLTFSVSLNGWVDVFFFFFLVIVNSSTPSSGYILPALPVINSYTNLITLARVILHQQNQVIHKNLYCCCYCVVYTLPSLSPLPPLFSNLDELEDREK